jgi:F-type H+-transporting ATPase subunit delta
MVNGSLDEVEDELFRFARLVERENSLREALESGWVGVDRKRELLVGLLEGKVAPITLRVVTEAAGESVRRRTVGEALAHFSVLAAELRDRMNARVTLAVEPTEEQLDKLRQELSRVFGVTMGLRVEIDPDILGGAVIRVGDQVMDASIARRIDTARRGLAPA